MASAERIVKKPVKIDFHIHSAASAHKDGRKVQEGTVENIDILFSKLEENEVNMAAITDHDIFDYDIYNALRSKIEDAQFLQRVLPGIEFTVSFKTKEGNKTVHVVALFDDSDPEAVKRISSAIPFKNGKPDYDKEKPSLKIDIGASSVQLVLILSPLLTRKHRRDQPKLETTMRTVSAKNCITNSYSLTILKRTNTRTVETNYSIGTMPTTMTSRKGYASLLDPIVMCGVSTQITIRNPTQQTATLPIHI